MNLPSLDFLVYLNRKRGRTISPLDFLTATEEGKEEHSLALKIEFNFPSKISKS